ncbi:MAG TPA: ATP-binding protein [Gemmatimonadaceae bacterium]
MRSWLFSLRFQLTFWYAALLAVPLIAFAIICYVVFSNALLSRTDRFIDDAISAFSRELIADRRATASLDFAMQTTIAEVRFPDLGISILDSARRVVASTRAPRDADLGDRRPSGAVETGIDSALRDTSAHALAMTVGDGRGSYRLLSRPLTLRGRAFTIAASYPLSDIEDVLARIRRLFTVAIPALVLVAAFGGFFLAKRSLAPVAAMTQRASAISAANLGERLPVGGGEELAGLARVINELLDRLESSFEQQRRFMADASHELRTPTAILRAESDVTLSREQRAEGEYRESFTVIRDAARRLTRIVDDLFLLARADSGHLVPRRVDLHLDEVVQDAVRGVRQVADARGVRVTLDAAIEAPFSGDADLLGRVLLNLLDNAIRHSPQGSAVSVTMSRSAGRFEVRVRDSGPGIRAEDQSRVFDRFFRADPARSRAEATTTSGAGLGLAIGRRIVELHGGSLELVESRAGCTEFLAALPAQSPS